MKSNVFELVQDMPWALHPSKLEQVSHVIESRIAEADLPLAFDSAIPGPSGNGAEEAYEVRNGTAIIPVYGVLSKRMNMFSRFSGGTSTELLAKDFQQALEDPYVKGILLDVDSPGGSVDGTQELADLVYRSRGKKPVVAYANGLMASAAYWIGSAADRIVAGETTMVGSIGVALTHYDYSKADEKYGVKRTNIYAGKYKRIASDEKPLSEDGREYLQGMVDTFYTLFVEGVARNRGVSVEAVLQSMADGREYIGKQALEHGLVDHIGDLESALTLIQSLGGSDMDVKTLKEKHPEVYEEVYAAGNEAGRADAATAKDEGHKAGVNQERARVVELLDSDAPIEAVTRAIKDGVEVSAAYKQFFEAEKKRRADALTAMEDAAPKPVGQEQPKEPEAKDTRPADVRLDEAARKIMSEQNVSYPKACSIACRENPELKDAWAQSRLPN